MGVPVRTITGTAGSLKPHPLHTPRTVGELTRAALECPADSPAGEIDLVHANSIRAGIVASAVARGWAASRRARGDVLPDGPGRV